MDASRLAIEDVTTWLDSTLGRKPVAEVSARELMRHWRRARDECMSKPELAALAIALDGLGFGVEPDPRFGGDGVRPDQKIVIFKLAGAPLKVATPAYQVATLLLDLTAFVAISDGQVQESEERQLEAHLERFVVFNAAERQRLRMHLRWLLAEKPRRMGMNQRLRRVDVSQRQKLAEYAVAMAAADGIIEASEVRTVEKIYKILGLDPGLAHQVLHGLQAVEKDPPPAQSPVAMHSSSKAPVCFSISTTLEVVPSAGLRLDTRRIQQVLANTEAVSSLLSEIFDEDESAPGAVENPVGHESEAYGNDLDAAHARLLELLANCSELRSAVFERLAVEVGLLPCGAYEVLNELAFERVDAPLLEGCDPIEVDLAVLQEIMK